MLSVFPIDYEIPQPKKQRSWPFWTVFILTYLAGVFVISFIDYELNDFLHGARMDDVFLPGFFLAVFFARAAAITKRAWRQCDSIAFAAIFALLAPFLLFLLLFVIREIFRHTSVAA